MELHPPIPMIPHGDTQRWSSASPPPRPRSQPPPRRDRERARKRSANSVKPRPADPRVISSIISSLETLSPPILDPDQYYAESGTRPYSAATSPPAPSRFPHSVTMPAINGGSFGLEYPARAEDNDDDYMSDAALPPVIRTSRPPSGLSSPSAPRSPSLTNGGVKDYLSITSRRSSRSASLASKEKDDSKRGSAESWTKPKSMSQESLSTTYTRKPRSLRRIESQETLRPAAVVTPQKQTNGTFELSPSRTGERPLTGISESPSYFDVSPETSMAASRTPPTRASSKYRLYLGETSTNEEPPIPDLPKNVATFPEVVESPTKAGKRPVGDEENRSPRSPARVSPIADSIPLRTSSLRHSTSPVPKKKDRKAKRQTLATSKVSSRERSTTASLDQSWADLGEDDLTVKRIKELQKQREIRLRESKVYSTGSDPQTAKPEVAMPVMSASRLSHEEKRASRVRPAANRAATEPPTKAHKVLGLTNDHPLPKLQNTRTVSVSPELVRLPRRSHDETRPLSSYRPPTSSTLQTPPLSLDYSYAQAVNLLQDVQAIARDRDSSSSKRQSGSLPNRNSLWLKGLDLQQTAKSTPATPSRSNSHSRKPKVPQDRWTTAHHPDLPLDFDKRKSRRKSMSDARNTRILEEESAIARRDSIADAVDVYLSAPRLSRRVQHPMTGRIISYSEVGDPNGAAVFICVGMGLTRYVTAFYDELATTLRLRLITPERAGVGNSESYPSSDRSGPLSWPEDVLAICEALNITKFSLLAHSAGAIYALATALILPQLIRGKVHLLAPWIPPSQLESIHHLASTVARPEALPRSQRFLRVLPTPFLKVANSSFMNATSASLKPATRQRTPVKSRQTSESPTRGPPLKHSERPDYTRRESMMLMDQFMPATNPMENFPIPVEEEDEDVEPLQNPSIFLSATATPTDPEFTFASTHLNAAEHAARERQAEYTTQLTQRTWELATRDSNPAVDLLVCLERHRDVGFRYVDVGREVVITHGSEDKRVPLANVKWLAEQMNRRALVGAYGGSVASRDDFDAELRSSRGGCEVRVLEGEGHGLMASAIIMGDVLTEIAGYAVGEERERRGATM